ncbi:MAG: ATP-binding protein [Syntrophobacteraceae bacterium]|nr:ATP-binding protein [Syntrophobacteraceae bacterium]
MARSDLLIALVKAGSAGDKRGVRAAAEAIIAEEHAKQHKVLAERLTKAIQTNGQGTTHAAIPASDQSGRARDFIAEIMPCRRLEDLVLSDDCRQNITELIEEQQRASLLRSHSLDPRHRVLLVGPPGNGKTSLAEAIAEALAVPFLVVRYEAMIGSFLGETASRLKRVFDYARTTPCLLFFDEFDAVGKERGDIHETGEIKRVVTSLLMQIDDLPSYTIVVAATNHAELLDRAVWRRFQLRVGLPAPTAKELTRYFEQFFKSFNEKPRMNIATLVKRLGQLSYAEAEQFTLDIRRRWILSMKEQALDTVIEGRLRFWQDRAQPISTKNKEAPHGRKTSPGAPKAE